jgi:hypothetical protein
MSHAAIKYSRRALEILEHGIRTKNRKFIQINSIIVQINSIIVLYTPNVGGYI